MNGRQESFRVFSDSETARFAVTLGTRLRKGDCVLLSGEIGAGKTFLARALIQSLLAEPEDVPSPTYTLVQTYETRAGDLWHSDLYRITDTAEIEELGLTEAFVSAICLVEWPDRLGNLAPKSALHLTLKASDTDDNETRLITLSWTDTRWDAEFEILKEKTQL